MALADRAVWCVLCGAPPTMAITVERNGVMAHYGSCDDHVGAVAARVRRDESRASHPSSTPVRGATGHTATNPGTLASVPGAIDVGGE